MEQTQIWILSAALGVLTLVVSFFLKNWIGQVSKGFSELGQKVESMVAVLTEIKIILTGYGKDIEHLQDEIVDIKTRLNSHSERIHDLEKEK